MTDGIPPAAMIGISALVFLIVIISVVLVVRHDRRVGTSVDAL